MSTSNWHNFHISGLTVENYFNSEFSIWQAIFWQLSERAKIDPVVSETIDVWRPLDSMWQNIVLPGHSLAVASWSPFPFGRRSDVRPAPTTVRQLGAPLLGATRGGGLGTRLDRVLGTGSLPQPCNRWVDNQQEIFTNVIDKNLLAFSNHKSWQIRPYFYTRWFSWLFETGHVHKWLSDVVFRTRIRFGNEREGCLEERERCGEGTEIARG